MLPLHRPANHRPVSGPYSHRPGRGPSLPWPGPPAVVAVSVAGRFDCQELEIIVHDFFMNLQLLLKIFA